MSCLNVRITSLTTPLIASVSNIVNNPSITVINATCHPTVFLTSVCGTTLLWDILCDINGIALMDAEGKSIIVRTQ